MTSSGRVVSVMKKPTPYSVSLIALPDVSDAEVLVKYRKVSSFSVATSESNTSFSRSALAIFISKLAASPVTSLLARGIDEVEAL